MTNYNDFADVRNGIKELEILLQHLTHRLLKGIKRILSNTFRVKEHGAIAVSVLIQFGLLFHCFAMPKNQIIKRVSPSVHMEYSFTTYPIYGL